MRLFAIADLHLPGGQDKPMAVFGDHWEGHFERISADWRARVAQEDVVLLPGDLSWAMSLEAAKEDLEAVFALPGQKVLLRGNHDYWWPSVSRLRALAPAGVWVVQNDALAFEGFVLAGSRGWQIPKAGKTCAQDEKIYKRELLRLELSLKDARKKAPDSPLICMLHYPPLLVDGQASGFTQLLEAYAARACVYGHLHGEALRGAFNGVHNGILYKNASCDGLGFRLLELDATLLHPQSAAEEDLADAPQG